MSLWVRGNGSREGSDEEQLGIGRRADRWMGEFRLGNQSPFIFKVSFMKRLSEKIWELTALAMSESKLTFLRGKNRWRRSSASTTTTFNFLELSLFAFFLRRRTMNLRRQGWSGWDFCNRRRYWEFRRAKSARIVYDLRTIFDAGESSTKIFLRVSWVES